MKAMKVWMGTGIALALISMTTPAQAAHWGKIKVTSDVPAQVAMDGVVQGSTPLQIHKVRDGDHFVKVTAYDTGKVQVMELHVPAVPFYSKEVSVFLGPGRSYSRY